MNVSDKETSQTTLPVDTGSVPNTHLKQLTPAYNSPGLFGFLQALHTQT